MARQDKGQRVPGMLSGMPHALTPLRAKLKHLTDEQLRARLSGFGIELDRESLGRLCAHHLGAVQVTEHLVDQPALKGRFGQSQIHEIENCVAHLWQRWFPELSSFENFEERLMAGNELLEAHDAVRVCRVWLEAWAQMRALLDRGRITSIEEFERQYNNGMRFVRHWIHALDNQLWNAGLDDPQFLRTRIALCEQCLKRFAADESLSELCRMALAQSHFELNDAPHTDSLYRQWLGADPQWGWGWISWARCYQSARPEMKDLKRAEQILLEGRAVDQVRDADDITTNLGFIYEQQGRLQESRTLLASVQSTADLRRSEPKVGRNDPCPCGSGKKFKKCCGSASAAT